VTVPKRRSGDLTNCLVSAFPHGLPRDRVVGPFFADDYLRLAAREGYAALAANAKRFVESL